MEEIWKKYKSGFYEVSNMGRVKNTKTEQILKGTIMRNGYVMYHLRCENDEHQLGHRLVALLFIDNPLQKEQVNHINGIKTDNRIENLEWTTAQENMEHSFVNGLQSREMKTIFCFTLNGDFIAKYKSSAEITKTTQFDGGSILQACKASHIAYNLWWTFSETFDRLPLIKSINKMTLEEQLFYTQKDCCEEYNISPASMSRYVNNKRQHPLYEFIKMKI
jgi:hypothetical protein